MINYLTSRLRDNLDRNILNDATQYGNVNLLELFLGITWGFWYVNLLNLINDPKTQNYFQIHNLESLSLFSPTGWKTIFVLVSLLYVSCVILYYPSFVKNIRMIPSDLMVMNTFLTVCKQLGKFFLEFAFLLWGIWFFIFLVGFFFHSQDINGVQYVYGVTQPVVLFLLDSVNIWLKKGI
jgi:hypothetical protein